MSTPKVGDRVRIVIEEDVLETFDDGGIATVGHLYDIGELGVVSIEVFTPPFVLPTKLWAQVVDCEGELWTRADPIFWHDLMGAAISKEELLKISGLRIISEGVDDE